MIRNILITGRPGCGKSTLIKRLIEGLGGEWKIAGIVTPEIRKNHKRFGFRIIDLLSGEGEILASVDIKSEIRVSKYFVNLDGIEKILDKFMESFEEADLFVVDEIGKMELLSGRFRDIIIKILDSEKPVVATVALSKDPFIEGLKKRKDSKVFYLERRGLEKILKEVETTISRIL